jgi:inactivated superfamily I helicase
MKQAAEVNKAFNNFVAQAQDPEKLLQLLQHPSLKYDEENRKCWLTRSWPGKIPA